MPPENPEFLSLTNAVHAVNWQEREIQDLMEGLVRHVFKQVLDVDLPRPDGQGL